MQIQSPDHDQIKTINIETISCDQNEIDVEFKMQKQFLHLAGFPRHLPHPSKNPDEKNGRKTKVMKKRPFQKFGRNDIKRP